jgi:hypothetical protein
MGVACRLIDPADAVAMQAKKSLPMPLLERTGTGKLELLSTGNLADLQSFLASLKD